PVELRKRGVRAPNEDAGVPEVAARRQVGLGGAQARLLDEAPDAVAGTDPLADLDVAVAGGRPRGLDPDGDEPAGVVGELGRGVDRLVEPGADAVVGREEPGDDVAVALRDGKAGEGDRRRRVARGRLDEQ